jgi:hypothetical protein
VLSICGPNESANRRSQRKRNALFPSRASVRIPTTRAAPVPTSVFYWAGAATAEYPEHAEVRPSGLGPASTKNTMSDSPGGGYSIGEMQPQSERFAKMPLHGVWDGVNLQLMKGKVSSPAEIYWPLAAGKAGVRLAV